MGLDGLLGKASSATLMEDASMKERSPRFSIVPQGVRLTRKLIGHALLSKICSSTLAARLLVSKVGRGQSRLHFRACVRVRVQHDVFNLSLIDVCYKASGEWSYTSYTWFAS